MGVAKGKNKEAAWLHEFKLHIFTMHNQACDRCAFLLIQPEPPISPNLRSHRWMQQQYMLGLRERNWLRIRYGSSIHITYRGKCKIVLVQFRIQVNCFGAIRLLRSLCSWFIPFVRFPYTYRFCCC